MRITSIQIVNSGVIECFDVQLNGDNLELSGRTGSGKTTAASALFDIIKKRSDQLRHGEKRGEISVTLDDGSKTFYAERKNTPSGSTVSITAVDSKGKTNISINEFKKMLSELSVNPHKIMDLTPRQQTETLLKSAKIEIDLDAVDLLIAETEAERLAAYRAIDTFNIVDKPVKTEPVDILELISERDEMQEANSKGQKTRDFLTGLKDDRDSIVRRMDENLKSIELIQKQLDSATDDLKKKDEEKKDIELRIQEGEKVVSKLSDFVLDEITLKINTAQKTNDDATKYSQWVERDKSHTIAVDAHKKFEDKARQLHDDKKQALDSAKWPIDGLVIDDGNIIYNGCLLSNLGESEQMLVCAALAIEDIKKHSLKVVRMDGVESMSKEDFIHLQNLFNGEGIQVLSTRVSRGDVEPQEIVITDGKY